MLLKVAMRCRFLEEGVKELHGTHRKPRMTLHQHTKRETYQAGYCWGQVIIAELPSPGDQGCTRKEPSGWKVFWTNMPESKGREENLCDVVVRKLLVVNAKV